MKTLKDIPNIELYSDGGAEPNPGKGGFGVVLAYKGIKKEFFRGYRLTTNNRMELMGVIFGLEQLKTKCSVQVYTDSRYVVDGIEKGWAEGWKKNGWNRRKNRKAVNSDLWERLLSLLSVHDVKFHWVKGHAGHPENERCDYLANLGINSNELFDDDGYIPDIEKPTDFGIDKSKVEKVKPKGKVEKVGDCCRKCNTPVIKTSPKKRKIKPGQTYYFEYYLLCPKCNTMYMVEEAKKLIWDRNRLF